MKTKLLALLAIASSAIASDVATRPDDYYVFEIYGTCMEPVLKNGQLVLLDTKWSFDKVVCGDVIKFWYRGRRYVHRVVEDRKAGNGERYLVTKGDNINHREIVTIRDYIGRVETE